MSTFFQFEADFVDALRCIPMVVRFKLDTCGIKLKLQQWHQLLPSDRQALVDGPCTTNAEISAYRERLQQRLLDCTGATAAELPIDPQPAWLDPQSVPPDLIHMVPELGVALTLEQWAMLTPLQRFALIKLSRPGHENRNLLPALKEFGLG